MCALFGEEASEEEGRRKEEGGLARGREREHFVERREKEKRREGKKRKKGKI